MSTSIHPARPLGPRTRAASPLPPVRRPEQPTLLTAPSPPNSRSPTPKLGLAIPGSSPSPALSLAPPAASSKPSLKLKLSLGPAAPAARPAADPDEPDSDGFFPGGYYGGPALAPLPLGPKAAGDTTIRPDDTIADTRRPKPPSIGDVTSTLEAMRLRAASNASASSSTILSAASDADTVTSTASASSAGNGSGSAIKTPQEHSVEPYPYSDWNDDVFVVQARLGEGAGGAVHEVRDTRTGVVMARKTIQTREAPMKQLLRELNLITTISHPNIIRFFGAYMSPSSSEVKVVMEVCEGRSLESVGKNIRGRGLRVGEKVAGRLAEGVLQGLAYLRSKDLIHRDIKPSNILLSRDGVVKLCDFGVSGELVGSVVDTFTGTSLYMAPERLSGLEYSIRADVWSTGLSILELVQNRFPFSADLAPIELMIHITQSEPPQLEDEDGFRWSDEMKDFINQTLRVDPALRPTPKDLLSHPWIVHIMAIDVNMARWIREVWGWPKPARKPKEGTS